MRAALSLLLAAQAADVVTTAYGMAHGTHEVNPAVVAVLAAGGLALFALAKLGPVAGLALVGRYAPALARAVAYVVAGAVFMVALENVRAILS